MLFTSVHWTRSIEGCSENTRDKSVKSVSIYFFFNECDMNGKLMCGQNRLYASFFVPNFFFPLSLCFKYSTNVSPKILNRLVCVCVCVEISDIKPVGIESETWQISITGFLNVFLFWNLIKSNIFVNSNLGSMIFILSFFSFFVFIFCPLAPFSFSFYLVVESHCRWSTMSYPPASQIMFNWNFHFKNAMYADNHIHFSKFFFYHRCRSDDDERKKKKMNEKRTHS